MYRLNTNNTILSTTDGEKTMLNANQNVTKDVTDVNVEMLMNITEFKEICDTFWKGPRPEALVVADEIRKLNQARVNATILRGVLIKRGDFKSAEIVMKGVYRTAFRSYNKWVRAFFNAELYRLGYRASAALEGINPTREQFCSAAKVAGNLADMISAAVYGEHGNTFGFHMEPCNFQLPIAWNGEDAMKAERERYAAIRKGEKRTGWVTQTRVGSAGNDLSMQTEWANVTLNSVSGLDDDYSYEEYIAQFDMSMVRNGFYRFSMDVFEDDELREEIIKTFGLYELGRLYELNGGVIKDENGVERPVDSTEEAMEVVKNKMASTLFSQVMKEFVKMEAYTSPNGYRYKRMEKIREQLREDAMSGYETRGVDGLSTENENGGMSDADFYPMYLMMEDRSDAIRRTVNSVGAVKIAEIEAKLDKLASKFGDERGLHKPAFWVREPEMAEYMDKEYETVELVDKETGEVAQLLCHRFENFADAKNNIHLYVADASNAFRVWSDVTKAKNTEIRIAKLDEMADIAAPMVDWE